VLIQINEAGALGVIAERPPHELPFNAWSAGGNVRFRNNLAEKFMGEEVVFSPSSNGAYYLLQVSDATTDFWLQAGLEDVYVWNGSVHSDITNVGGPYIATALAGWTGCVLGGVPILNNGFDPPQQWLPLDVGQKLVDLANWPANTVAGAVRAFKNHLIALHITKNSTVYPQMIKWSHPAAGLTVPSSWDETDDTKDAGEFEIATSNGAVVDGMQLRDLFVVYKEDAVHAMQYVGGPKVFNFIRFFDNFGLLARNCAAEFTSGKHAVFALGDIIIHDGQSWESIVSRKMRDWVFKQMNANTFSTSFVAQIPQRFEVFFCFPSAGSLLPNLALVWNWKEDTLGVRDLDQVAHFAAGRVNSGVSEVWDADPNPWNTDETVWDEVKYNPSGLRILSTSPDTPKLALMDATNTFNGAPFRSYVERTGLALPVTEDGPPDMHTRKLFKRLWPRIDGTDGATIKVYVGKQDKIDGPVTWSAARDFIIGTTESIDFLLNGRLFAVRFESTTDMYWRVLGYQVEVVPAGQF